MDTVPLTSAQRLSAASTIGRAHLARHEGGQDAHALRDGTTREGWPFHVGVVADGCGSAPGSFVGATLLATVAARESAALLTAGLSPAGLVEPVLAACRRALFGVLAAVGEPPRAFVEAHLLATLFVLASDGRSTVVFGRGDGLLVVGDEVLVLDEGGAPRYLAYDLFDTPTAPFVRVVDGLPRALIATDGLDSAHAEAAFGHQGRGLRRWLNVLADRAPLLDDATVVVLEPALLPLAPRATHPAFDTSEGGHA